MISMSQIKKSRATCAAMLIIRDAQDTVERCVNSLILANCIDQFIFVLDSRTKDNTIQLIKKYVSMLPNSVVEFFDWLDDHFAMARNVSLRLANDVDYGFWMDDDDVLLDGKGLYDTLTNPQGNAYLFKILVTTPEGRIDIIDHLRLFPLVKGIKWELPIHEQIAFSIRESGIKEIPTNYRILHTGYSSYAEVAQKHKRNLRVLQKHIKSICSQPGPRCDYFSARYKESTNFMRNSK